LSAERPVRLWPRIADCIFVVVSTLVLAVRALYSLGCALRSTTDEFKDS
jgi:hypothetical protein